MQSSRRPKTFMEAERHTLEFSSGQLIIAICGLLLLWLFGFLVGVVAGRFEFGTKLGEEVAAVEVPPPSGTAAPAKPSVPAAKRDTSPDPKSGAAAPRNDAPKAGARTSAPPPPPSKPEPTPAKQAPSATSKNDAPAPDQGGKAEGEVKFVSDRPREDRPTSAATATSAPPLSIEPIAPPPDDAETPTEAPKAVAKADEAKPAEAGEPTADGAKPAAGKGRYTVQVFSARSSNRDKAEKIAAQLKEKGGLSAEVITSKDKKFCQVVVGRYPDRPTAEKARGELQDKLKKAADIADSIVREL